MTEGTAYRPTGGAPDGSPAKPAAANAGHTPGPWRDGEDGFVTAPADGRGEPIVAEVTDHDDGAWVANARLIAAAPELLEALEKTPLRARNEDPRAFDDRQTEWLRDYFNPAIAKARGQ